MLKDKKPPVRPSDSFLDGLRLFAALHESLRVQDVLRKAAERIRQRFEIDGVDIHLADAASGRLGLAGRFGLSPDFSKRLDFRPTRGRRDRCSGPGKPSTSGGIPMHPAEGFRAPTATDRSGMPGVPIADRGKTIGVLSCHSNQARELAHDDRRLLAEVGRQLGLALSNAAVHELAEQKAHRFIAMSRVITATRHLGTLDGTLQDIAKVMVQALGFDQAWIGLMDAKDAVIRGKAGFGAGMTAKLRCRPLFPSTSPCPIRPSRRHCPEARGVHRSRERCDESFRQWLKRLRGQSFAFVPILNGGER